MGRGRAHSWRRAAALVAAGLLILGVLATAVRLDTPADPGLVRLGWSAWRPDGVVVDVPPAEVRTELRSGETVTAIAGHPLADPPGGVARPNAGEVLPYRVDGTIRPVVMLRPEPRVLLLDGWGNLVFVLALAGLALALYVRRPEEPGTAALLVGAAGLFGSTLVVVAGLPVLALATGGPLLLLFHLATGGAYLMGWGGIVALALLLSPGHPWLRHFPRLVLLSAYAGPAGILGLWVVGVVLTEPTTTGRFALVSVGSSVILAVTQLVAIAAGVVAYRAAAPELRTRLRWLAGSGLLAVGLGLVGWVLPELLTGRQLLPGGAIGLAGLPFVAGLAVALRRHQLFDIERLVNRSLVYGIVLTVLVASYAGLVGVLVVVLDLSDAVAAALAAAVVALVLAPLRGLASRTVNRLMYGHRDDPARVLNELGARLQSVLLPSDVLPAAVEVVADSLRVPFVAVDLADGTGEFRPAAEHGRPVGPEHETRLVHHGETVGRLRVSGRGRDDPLDATDLVLIEALASQIGPAVQAVRLHQDLVRSRAAVVASREDERRRLRRDLHDGLGPSLAAIRLKAGLAARSAPAGSPTRTLLDQIGAEVESSISDVRRVVDALRPPALDELGLVGAIRARAESLAGDIDFTVTGPETPTPLPAAVETAAYRIVVEALTNAARHSQAQRCAVRVDVGPAEVRVEVVDDGVGLDPARPPHVGLWSMHERAAEVGGRCAVLARPEGGTVVRATLPLTVDGRPAIGRAPEGRS
ncbi:MAG TPA: histidine kinase [Propionibacteriaceae bacterium]|nr:histidine kinase [Propionibacteriaceae bacterium]